MDLLDANQLPVHFYLIVPLKSNRKLCQLLPKSRASASDSIPNDVSVAWWLAACALHPRSALGLKLSMLHG